jgi:hypothetical protein
LKEQLLNLAKPITLAKKLIQKTEQSLNMEVTNEICDSEIYMENMQLSKVHVIPKDYEIWKEYRENM